MAYRLIKSEPSVYSRDDFILDGRTSRDGVRNFQARNNLREMKPWDSCFRYHSNEGKEIVGVAQVVREAYPDPTATDEKWDWVAVDVEPVYALKRPVSLEMIKGESQLSEMELLRLQRLSVSRVREEEWEKVMEMSK